MPKIYAPKLTVVDVNRNVIEDLGEFFGGKEGYGRLVEIQAESNRLKKLPLMSVPNIRRMHFQNNLI